MRKRESSSHVLHSPFTYGHYRHILNSILTSGYRFVSFPELVDSRLDEQFVCCLRHDCDNDLTAAARMAEIEEETGVRSTYFLMLRSAMYNLVCIPNLELVRQIIRRGHEIGVHFDEQACPNLNATRIAKCVDWERALLSREFGVKVNVASFHQPSQRVLDNCIKLNCINTNDRGDMRGVYYISDSNTVWKEGVGARYSSTWAGFCPSERFLRRQHSRVQLLTHPEWWTQEEMTVRQKWNQMLRNNFELIQASLLGREKTYTERHEMAFT